ncbi:MAG: hypothetical protein RL356_341, partial [Actinomycetota bacterium]
GVVTTGGGEISLDGAVIKKSGYQHF